MLVVLWRVHVLRKLTALAVLIPYLYVWHISTCLICHEKEPTYMYICSVWQYPTCTLSSVPGCDSVSSVTGWVRATSLACGLLAAWGRDRVGCAKILVHEIRCIYQIQTRTWKTLSWWGHTQPHYIYIYIYILYVYIHNQTKELSCLLKEHQVHVTGSWTCSDLCCLSGHILPSRCSIWGGATHSTSPCWLSKCYKHVCT